MATVKASEKSDKAKSKKSDKQKNENPIKTTNEARTICQWCGSTTAIIVKIVIVSYKKVGKLGTLIKNVFAKQSKEEESPEKKPQGLPKIEIQELKPKEAAPPSPAEPKNAAVASTAKEAGVKTYLKETTFNYKDNKAKKVKLAGDFTKWEAIPMKRGIIESCG